MDMRKGDDLMGKNVGELSEIDLKNLIEEYYMGVKTDELIRKYDLNCNSTSIYKYFPPMVFSDFKCEFCGSALVMDRISKTKSKLPRDKKELYCPICGHKPYIQKCNCENCNKKRGKKLEEKRDLIYSAYSYYPKGVSFDLLDFKIKVFLGTLCRGLLRENLFEIGSYQDSNVKLTPLQSELLKNIYNDLIKNQVIVVNPNSKIEAFEDGEDFPNVYYTYEVEYNLNVDYGKSKKDMVYKILNPSYYTQKNSECAYQLWVEIAVEECIEYLIYQLKKVDMNFSPGEKTYMIIKNMLEKFSVSQIYGIIWKGVTEATRFLVENKTTKQHAANTVIGFCQRYSERAIENNWNLKDFGRIRDLPQSVLSEFFFYKVLNIGELGFKMPPTYI